jgi:hypothetical protein
MSKCIHGFDIARADGLAGYRSEDGHVFVAGGRGCPQCREYARSQGATIFEDDTKADAAFAALLEATEFNYRQAVSAESASQWCDTYEIVLDRIAAGGLTAEQCQQLAKAARGAK